MYLTESELARALGIDPEDLPAGLSVEAEAEVDRYLAIGGIAPPAYPVAALRDAVVAIARERLAFPGEPDPAIGRKVEEQRLFLKLLAAGRAQLPPPPAIAPVIPVPDSPED